MTSPQSRPGRATSAASVQASADSPQLAEEHVRRLRSQGGSYRAIASAAGIGPMTVHRIASGQPPGPGTAAAVLTVTSSAVSRARVDAGGTRFRLRALHVMGHSSARIARAAGASEKTIRKLTRGNARTISPRLRDAITTVYDAWWDKRAPERNRAERSAAATARRRAISGNWCAGAALDDDQLDIPGYRPEHGWKPATGTGTAADIHPPARRTQAGVARQAMRRTRRRTAYSEPSGQKGLRHEKGSRSSCRTGAG